MPAVWLKNSVQITYNINNVSDSYSNQKFKNNNKTFFLKHSEQVEQVTTIDIYYFHTDPI